MNGLFLGLTLPMLGTMLGASCVLFMKHGINVSVRKALSGFAAGVMVAASVWSLLIPAIEMSGSSGFKSVFPAAIGFIFGMGFLLLLDGIIPHQHISSDKSEGPHSRLSRTSKIFFAVTIHNIPEGMAVGVALAAAMENSLFVPPAAAMALTVGIAVQNFPEGAIVAMPLHSVGNSRLKSFTLGSLSGIVEPLATFITILVTASIIPTLPYILSFAAGAMMYVVVEELIPDTQTGPHSNVGTIGFALGFVLMMLLDVILG